MAVRDVSAALKDAPQLRSFLLHDVTPTGKQLGGGSYGVVEELQTAGLVCAGKKIYDALIDPENQGAQAMVDKYYSECSLLSELRHPHVVQFLGICFLSDSQLPVLVMERLQTSLDNLLETTPDIPLRTKLSILQDVARGLVFLHNRSPAVIHRDLTARNVLLNAAMTAILATRPREQWMEALAAERLPFAPVNTLAEALADPQAAARGMVARIPLPDGGTCPASGNPIKLSGAGPDTYTAPPLLGQHTREVLAGVLGYDEARVARLLESGAFTAAADRAPGHGPPAGGGARPGPASPGAGV